MSDITVHQLNLPVTTEAKSTLSKNFFKSDVFKTMLFTFDAGEELSDHSSKKNAVLHVLSGNGNFSILDETVALSPGTWINIPPNVTHRVEAHSVLHFLLYLI